MLVLLRLDKPFFVGLLDALVCMHLSISPCVSERPILCRMDSFSPEMPLILILCLLFKVLQFIQDQLVLDPFVLDPKLIKLCVQPIYVIVLFLQNHLQLVVIFNRYLVSRPAILNVMRAVFCV